MTQKIRCDGFGCDEDHPLEHDMIGELGFAHGRWLGWMYLDLNRPDLIDRPMRFCSSTCCTDWIEREILTRQRAETALDRVLRDPSDELARKSARKSGLVVRPGG